MARKNRISLRDQIKSELDGMLGIGRSKHDDKILGIDNKYIYSWDTYKSYLKQTCYFADWVKKQPAPAELGHKARTLEEARRYVEAFLQDGIGRKLSPYTTKLQAAALAKLYHCSIQDFKIETPSRYRAQITRSRGEKVRDKNFNEEKHQELVNFCKCTGLRRSELELLRGENLCEKDGKYYVNVVRGAKGGRPRTSPIVGSDAEVRAVVERMKAAGANKVFSYVSTNADIHSYRGEYATRVYDAHKRDLSEFRNERIVMYKSHAIVVYTTPGCHMDRSQAPDIHLRDANGNMRFKPGYKDVPTAYYCRKDLKKVAYDRLALLAASQALGHNRECVVAEHYIKA